MDLAIFLKAPAPGKVKTRLCPPLSPLEAADLYTAFLADVLATAACSTATGIHLFHAGPAPDRWLPPALLDRLDGPGRRLRLRPQTAGDLGTRLAHAVAACDEAGAAPVLLLGSDSPDLPAAHLEEALAAAAGGEVVLGPAPDGGVWAIGVPDRDDGLFADIPWSTGAVAAALGARAATTGRGGRLLAEWPDVDEISDLRALWRRLEAAASTAPRTHAWLRRWPRRPAVLEGP